MNSDTAELAIVDAGSELVVPLEPGIERRRRGLALRERWARLREDPAHLAAVADSWRALWSSRLLVWASAVGTLVAFEPPRQGVVDQPADH